MNRLAISSLLLFTAAAFASPRDDDWRDWPYSDQETIQKTFNLSGAEPKRLLVDTLSGYIHVNGYSGSEVRVTVHRETRGYSNAALAEARREVTLDMSQQGNYVRLYEDGPFRNHDGGTNWRGDRYYGYHVNYDIDMEVPAATELDLHGFNNGVVQVRETSGPFNVRSFNGGIDMQDIAGYGHVQTFNGSMKVAFRQNPDRDCSFKTFNGEVDVYFQPNVNADLHFKTFHGGVFSDFDVAPLPTKIGAGQNLNARFIYRSNGGGSGRAGQGGPNLSFEGFNGSIRLQSKGNR
jgi:hypothetical protein